MLLLILILILVLILKIPFRLAEKRRLSRWFRDVLSEGEARVSHPTGLIEYRRKPEGQACGWPFFTFMKAIHGFHPSGQPMAVQICS